MRKYWNIVPLIVMAFIVLAGMPDAFCQTRTTPVEITKPVQINTVENPIKAAQDGSWMIGIDPFYNTVKAQLVGAPAVNVSSLPNVKIDPSANTVQQSVKQTSYLLWSTDQTLRSSFSATSVKVQCKGYRELHVIVSTDSTSPEAKVQLWWYRTPNASSIPIGEGNFASSSSSVITGGNFKSFNCAFTCPVMGEMCEIVVRNNTGADMHVWSEYSWAYLTD